MTYPLVDNSLEKRKGVGITNARFRTTKKKGGFPCVSHRLDEKGGERKQTSPHMFRKEKKEVGRPEITGEKVKKSGGHCQYTLTGERGGESHSA